jgi:hypothetical protein
MRLIITVPNAGMIVGVFLELRRATIAIEVFVVEMPAQWLYRWIARNHAARLATGMTESIAPASWWH